MMIGPDSLGVGWVEGLLALVGFTALFLWLAARVVGKAGYSGWWALALFLPLLNIVAVWLFAFALWPGVPKDGRCAAD